MSKGKAKIKKTILFLQWQRVAIQAISDAREITKITSLLIDTQKIFNTIPVLTLHVQTHTSAHKSIRRRKKKWKRHHYISNPKINCFQNRHLNLQVAVWCNLMIIWGDINHRFTYQN